MSYLYVKKNTSGRYSNRDAHADTPKRLYTEDFVTSIIVVFYSQYNGEDRISMTHVEEDYELRLLLEEANWVCHDLSKDFELDNKAICSMGVFKKDNSNDELKKKVLDICSIKETDYKNKNDYITKELEDYVFGFSTFIDMNRSDADNGWYFEYFSKGERPSLEFFDDENVSKESYRKKL